MSLNSKAKGKNAELEIVGLLREHGFDCRRSQQYHGAAVCDVIGLPGVHLEVKRREKGCGQIHQWLEQATNEARNGDIPIVACRPSRAEWAVVISLENFLRLLPR